MHIHKLLCAAQKILSWQSRETDEKEWREDAVFSIMDLWIHNWLALENASIVLELNCSACRT